MKLYRYWAPAERTVTMADGKKISLKKWAGSNDSPENARKAAVKAVDVLAEKVGSLSALPRRHEYEYSRRDIPEELVGEPRASYGITRNRYGSLVLNAAEAMFVDVDIPRVSGMGALVRKLMRRPMPEREARERLARWMSQHPEAGVRIYRTAAGFRYLFTHAPLKVDSRTLEWMKELGSDGLYTRLCSAQSCYRARLTPKPWRISMPRPPNDYPRETEEARAAFRDWISAYEEKAAGFAVCGFMEALGSSHVHRSIDDIVKEHDRMTRADSGLALA